MQIDDLKGAIRTALVAVAFVSAGVTSLVLLGAVLTGNTDKILEWGAGQIVDAVHEAVFGALLQALTVIALSLWRVALMVAAIVAVFVAMVKGIQEGLRL